MRKAQGQTGYEINPLQVEGRRIGPTPLRKIVIAVNRIIFFACRMPCDSYREVTITSFQLWNRPYNNGPGASHPQHLVLGWRVSGVEELGCQDRPILPELVSYLVSLIAGTGHVKNRRGVAGNRKVS